MTHLALPRIIFLILVLSSVVAIASIPVKSNEQQTMTSANGSCGSSCSYLVQFNGTTINTQVTVTTTNPQSTNFLSTMLLVAEIVAACALVLMLLFGEDFVRRFFTGPKIELRIHPVGYDVPNEDRARTKEQCVEVVVKREPIGKLKAGFAITPNIEGQHQLQWWEGGGEVNLIPGVPGLLKVWEAYRKDRKTPIGIRINTISASNRTIHYAWNDWKKYPVRIIDLDLYFTGETPSGYIYADRKPWRMSINVESWDSLGLVWRSQ